MVQPYKHEPFTDFNVEGERQAYLNALETVNGYLGQDYDLIIGKIRKIQQSILLH